MQSRYTVKRSINKNEKAGEELLAQANNINAEPITVSVAHKAMCMVLCETE